ncbi:MAG: hypothetical protein HY062_01850 [Bacteroidetes bacterium]|nr:hypothetical protein [Bacteroidota bacterium]
MRPGLYSLFSQRLESYPYGFNGKLKDDEDYGEGNAYDYGYRLLDTRLGKFMSVDPMTKSFPGWSPYPYAMNRPIDGIDMDGLEWEQSTKDNKTNVSVNTSFSVNEDLKLSPEQVSKYQNAISELLDKTLKGSSNDTYTGKVTFNGGDQKKSNRLIPSIALYGEKHQGSMDEPMIAGSSSKGQTNINIYNKDGSIKSPEDLAEDVVHELLHTLRIDHPFETTQGPSTALTQVGTNAYASTNTTDPNIAYNIMNYPMISIDGKKLGDLWKEKRPTLITQDQLKLMTKEINLQMKGYGVMPKYNKGITLEQNAERFKKYYDSYWNKMPGTPVKKQ